LNLLAELPNRPSTDYRKNISGKPKVFGPKIVLMCQFSGMATSDPDSWHQNRKLGMPAVRPIRRFWQNGTYMSNSGAASSPQPTQQVKLSTKGLENPASLAISDFALIIGDERFECSRFEIAFLSPRITALLRQDPTIDEYELELGVDVDSDQEFVSECVKGLISLSRNGSFEVTERNFGLVKVIAKSFGNSELCETLALFRTDGEEVNSSNVVERLSLREFLEVSIAAELDYLSSHFYEIDVNVVKQVSHEDLNKILRSAQLRISSEDSLLDFILDLGADYFDLLGGLHCEYLSQSGMSRLLDSISRSEINDELWGSLCRRLLLFPSSEQLPDSRFHVKDFAFDSSQPFAGIIWQLSKECGGNVHTNGIVSITASSTESRACHQVADYDWTQHWYSNSIANSWIQFDFKNRRISPTHYTIKSDNHGGYHLLKWSLDCSHDGTSWVNLDRRETNDLNGNRVVKSYDCRSLESPSPFFRFIRLTQTGTNSSGYDHLMVTNVEFFGKVGECPAG
jgi:hypothetical protein